MIGSKGTLGVDDHVPVFRFFAKAAFSFLMSLASFVRVDGGVAKVIRIRMRIARGFSKICKQK